MELSDFPRLFILQFSWPKPQDQHFFWGDSLCCFHFNHRTGFVLISHWQYAGKCFIPIPKLFLRLCIPFPFTSPQKFNILFFRVAIGAEVLNTSFTDCTEISAIYNKKRRRDESKKAGRRAVDVPPYAP